MVYGLGLIGALALIWWVLSGHTEPLILGFGAFSILFSAGLAWRMIGGVDREVSPYLRAPRMLPYWSWLGGEIFKANVAVLKLALKPDIDLTPRLIRVKMTPETDLGRTVLANSITLTPGTVSMDLEENEILVHALDASLADPHAFEDMGARAAKAADGGENA